MKKMSCNDFARIGCPRGADPAYGDKLRGTKQVTLNASTGGAGPFPLINTLFSDPLNVVSTPINTMGMGKTNNLITFTSIINLPLGVSVTFNFEILRSINDGSAVKVGPTNTFSTLVTALESESFAFQFADLDVTPGLYTYSVQISTNSFVDIVPGACVMNATLSVLAVAN